MTSPDIRAALEPCRDWLIRKRGLWYLSGRSGYTSNPHEAGRYTQDEAEAEAAIEPWHMAAVHVRDVPDLAETRSAYASLGDGVVVPRRPTANMIGEGASQIGRGISYDDRTDIVCDVYGAMLDAAPVVFNEPASGDTQVPLPVTDGTQGPAAPSQDRGVREGFSCFQCEDEAGPCEACQRADARLAALEDPTPAPAAGVEDGDGFNEAEAIARLDAADKTHWTPTMLGALAALSGASVEAEAAAQDIIITAEMIEAGEQARLDHTDVYFDGSEVSRGDVVEHIYRAMVEASPTLPTGKSVAAPVKCPQCDFGIGGHEPGCVAAPAGEAVAIKALDWVPDVGKDGEVLSDIASTPFGQYYVERDTFSYSPTTTFYASGPNGFRQQCSTEAEAFAAAQADFERRGRSIIVAGSPTDRYDPTTQPYDEPFRHVDAHPAPASVDAARVAEIERLTAEAHNAHLAVAEERKLAVAAQARATTAEQRGKVLEEALANLIAAYEDPNNNGLNDDGYAAARAALRDGGQ